MPFTIVQTSPLELTDKDDNIISIPPGLLTESGGYEVVREPQFKEDREERRVVFAGNIEQGEVKVDVTYSIGIDGHEVEYVNVVKIPAGLEIQNPPNFKTLDH